MATAQAAKEIQRSVLEEWLNISGEAFETFIRRVCAWELKDDAVFIPVNADNEARTTVVRENVKFDRECSGSYQKWESGLIWGRVCEGRQESLRAAGLERAGVHVDGIFKHGSVCFRSCGKGHKMGMNKEIFACFQAQPAINIPEPIPDMKKTTHCTSNSVERKETQIITHNRYRHKKSTETRKCPGVMDDP